MAGLLAVIAAVVAVLVVVLGGGAHSSPRAVAERFVDATNEQDVEAARALLCRDLHDEFDTGDQLLLGDTGPLNSVRSALGEVRELDADRAEADVSLVGEAVPSGFGYTLRLTREDGGWYVCGFGIDLDLPGIGGR